MELRPRVIHTAVTIGLRRRIDHVQPDEGRSLMSHAVLAAAVALAGCGYKVDFADCEVTCDGSGECPDGFSCTEGLCRIGGATGACIAPGEMTLRQTADDRVERSLVQGCTNPDQTTADGSWYRVFSLSQAGITTPFDVSKVTIGICFAVGTPTIQVRVGSYTGGAADATLDLAKVSGLTTVPVPIAATQISRTVDVPITATVAPDANVLVEIEVPDLDGSGEQVNVGFTAGSESKPGYVRSPLCGPATPTTTTGAGLANARLVMTVTGTP